MHDPQHTLLSPQPSTKHKEKHRLVVASPGACACCQLHGPAACPCWCSSRCKWSTAKEGGQTGTQAPQPVLLGERSRHTSTSMFVNSVHSDQWPPQLRIGAPDTAWLTILP